MQLFFLIDPWNIPFADPVDLVLVKCSWILACFFLVSFGIILLKFDAILLEIWWKFYGNGVAVWWQFGGSLVAVLSLQLQVKGDIKTATKLPPNCHQTATKLPPNCHQNTTNFPPK